jgi:hypothetical protein
MGDCVIDLTKSLSGGVEDAFLPPPPAAPRAGSLRTQAFLGVSRYEQVIDRVEVNLSAASNSVVVKIACA